MSDDAGMAARMHRSGATTGGDAATGETTGDDGHEDDDRVDRDKLERIKQICFDMTPMLASG